MPLLDKRVNETSKKVIYYLKGVNADNSVHTNKPILKENIDNRAG